MKNAKKDMTYLVHGFNVMDKGAGSVKKLMPFLKRGTAGKVINYPYGWFGLISVLFRNKTVARNLAEKIHAENRRAHYKNENFIVGHSNGCAIIVEAMKLNVHFKNVILINPALKVDTVFPSKADHITVIYTSKDLPTKTARFLDKVPLFSLIIPNAWGAMGAKGFRGNDDRVQNIDMSDYLDGHSDIFSDYKVNHFGKALSDILYRNSIKGIIEAMTYYSMDN